MACTVVKHRIHLFQVRNLQALKEQASIEDITEASAQETAQEHAHEHAQESRLNGFCKHYFAFVRTLFNIIVRCVIACEVV